MTIRCDYCGAEVVEEATFCPDCGRQTKIVKISKEIISDIKKLRTPIQSIDDINEIIDYDKKKRKTNWIKMKRIALIALILNVVLFYLVLVIGRMIGVPVVFLRLFWIISFIFSVVLICIFSSIKLCYKDKVESATTHLLYHNYDKAINNYIKALKRDPKDINAWRGVSYLYFDVNEYNEAVKSCRSGLAIEPNDIILWWILASIYQKSDNEEKAKEVWERLGELGYEEELTLEISGTTPYFSIGKCGDT